MSEVELKEQIAKVLMGEIDEKPDYLTEQDWQECLKFATEILIVIKEAGYLLVEPVQLEVLRCVKSCPVLNYIMTEYPEVKLQEYLKTNYPQATIAHNEAKGQPYQRV